VQRFAQREQVFVVNFRVCVKARAGALAASRVRRVNEENRIPILEMFGDDLESVTLHEP